MSTWAGSSCSTAPSRLCAPGTSVACAGSAARIVGTTTTWVRTVRKQHWTRWCPGWRIARLTPLITSKSPGQSRYFSA
eukprot:8812156-Alexandrium_andersonii.AAC.1